MRCFVGLPLSGACQEALRELLARLRPLAPCRASWTRPENWHLTLKFLGEVPETRLHGLGQALGSVRFAPFSLRPGGAGFFPDQRRPRVFWIGLEQGGQEAAELARAVDQALAPLGFAPEARPFSAHLTLCRIRAPQPGDWRGLALETRKRSWPEVPVDRFVLWQSVLSPAGPEHGALAEFPSCNRPG